MTLNDIIDNKDSDIRELKRALVVKMSQSGIARKEIAALLNVLETYISRWCIHYDLNGEDASSLLLNYQGSTSYLSAESKTKIVSYLEEQTSITLLEFKKYVLNQYGVKYKSDQSYYDLLKLGKLSWKKTQKKNPRKDEEEVKKDKTSIRIKLGKRRKEIESEDLVVLYQDECHFCWGDVLGYVWSKQGSRTEVSISNEKTRQTYFGCVNPVNGEAFVKRYATGNKENTVEFLKFLVNKFPNNRLFILWDKATYHTSNLVKEYLKEINGGLAKKDWKITLTLLPTAAPEENPIETVWLKGKNHVRSLFEKCGTFADVKKIFEEYISNGIFDFEKMNNFGCFS